jgi:hypothetical protein
MAFLPALGMGLSAIGGIIGSGQAASAQKAATNAAATATAGQQQLTQQQLAIYQQLLQQYNQNTQPLQSPLSQQYGGLLAGDNASGIASADLNALQNPDQATGINVNGLTGNALDYLSNPQDTTSQQIGQPIVSSLMAGGAGDTNLGKMTPDAIQSLLSGGVTGNGTGAGVGSTALGYYLDQAAHGGISQDLQNNALGQQSTANARNIGDIRNAMGGTSNIGALLNSQDLNNNQQTASLIAQLTGQSQQLRTGAMGSALSAAHGIDQATNQNTQSALNDAGNLDAQSLQYMINALQSAGGLDAQKLQMLTGAQTLGSGQQQTDLTNLNAAQSTNESMLAQIQNYLSQGQAGATGVAAGLQGVAGEYGAGAAAAAKNAALGATMPNPFTGLGNSISAYANRPQTAPTTVNNYGATTYPGAPPASASNVQVSGDPTGLGWG